MKWRPSYGFFTASAASFAVATVSLLIPGLGGPMLFAFVTVCLVFLVFGAIEFKKEELASGDASSRRARPSSRVVPDDRR